MEPPPAWGRFKLLSQTPNAQLNHLVFNQNEHRVGRNRIRADLIINKPFISALHFMIKLEESENSAESVVKIYDLSRNGIFINEEEVGKGKEMVLLPNITVHLTTPGVHNKVIIPLVYKFELFKDAFSPEHKRLRHEYAAWKALQAAPAPAPAPASSSSSLAGQANKRSAEELVDKDDTTKKLDDVSNPTTPTKRPKHRVVVGKTTTPTTTSGTQPDALLQVNETLQKSNHALRKKLDKSFERDVELQERIGSVEKKRQETAKELKVALDQVASLELELATRTKQLQEKTHSMEQLEETRKQLGDTVSRLETQLTQEKETRVHLQQERDHLESLGQKHQQEHANLTAELRETISRNMQLEEQVQTLQIDKQALQEAVDAVKLRTEVIQEGQRGVTEEKIVLKTRLASAQQAYRQMYREMKTLGKRLLVSPASITDAMDCGGEQDQFDKDEVVHSSSNSESFPSEPSQATQDDYCADTQPEEGPLDEPDSNGSNSSHHSTQLIASAVPTSSLVSASMTMLMDGTQASETQPMIRSMQTIMAVKQEAVTHIQTTEEHVDKDTPNHEAEEVDEEETHVVLSADTTNSTELLAPGPGLGQPKPTTSPPPSVPCLTSAPESAVVVTSCSPPAPPLTLQSNKENSPQNNTQERRLWLAKQDPSNSSSANTGRTTEQNSDLFDEDTQLSEDMTGSRC